MPHFFALNDSRLTSLKNEGCLRWRQFFSCAAHRTSPPGTQAGPRRHPEDLRDFDEGAQKAVPPTDLPLLADEVDKPRIIIRIDPEQFLLIPSDPDGNIFDRSRIFGAHRHHFANPHLVQRRGHSPQCARKQASRDHQDARGLRNVRWNDNFIGHNPSRRKSHGAAAIPRPVISLYHDSRGRDPAVLNARRFTLCHNSLCSPDQRKKDWREAGSRPVGEGDTGFWAPSRGR